MHDFIHSYLIENNFNISKIKEDITYGIHYYKYLPPIDERKKRIRFDVLIIDNTITLTEVDENNKDESETYFTICRGYFVKNIDELKYLFSNHTGSYYWLLNSK